MKTLFKILCILFLINSITSILYSQSTFSAERIENAIINYLKSQSNEDIDIEIIQNIKPISFAENSVSASLSHSFNEFKGLGFVVIEFKKDGKTLLKEQIRVKIKKFRTLPITKRVIRIGEIIQKDDIEISKVDVSSTNESELVNNIDNLYGKIARNGIPKGSVIKKNDITNEILIKKGQIITIVAQSGAVTIKTLGTALQDGGIGDMIRVKRNGQNASILTGMIDENGNVMLYNSKSNLVR